MDQPTSSRSPLDSRLRPAYLIHENDLLAPIYDFWGILLARQTHQLVGKRTALKNGERFLEVGVGTGLSFAPLALTNPAGQNEGLDLSQSMLRRCQERLAHYGVQQYQLQRADARELPFPDQSFDLVLSCYLMNQIPPEDVGLVLREMYRVLKTGGRLLMANLTDEGWGFYNYLARRVPLLMVNCQPVAMSQAIIAQGFKDVSRYSYQRFRLASEILRAVRI